MIFVAMMLLALVGLGTQIEVGKKTVVKSVIAMIEWFQWNVTSECKFNDLRSRLSILGFVNLR